MTADEVNGIDPLDERDGEHEHRMAVLDRIADYGPPTAPPHLVEQLRRPARTRRPPPDPGGTPSWTQ
jgi:hypothetical protein